MTIGSKFDENFVRYLCETCTLSTCSTVQNIQYTPAGEKACKLVCDHQNRLLRPVKPTKIDLTHSYCTKVDLKLATCVCVFKVTTRETTSFAFFHFTPNYLGQLAMVYFETGLPYQ